MIAVSSDSKLRNVKDLISEAKAENGKMSYGSWGIGSPGHLGGAHLESLAGITMQHVPYREVSQLYTAVASGELAWAFASIPSSQGPYKAGRLKYIAIAGPKRIPQLPDVPTVAESGGPAQLNVNSFVVLVAPKGVPAAVKSKVNADVAKAVKDPEVAARFDTFAFEPLTWSPEEILKQAEAKSRTYEALIKRANISLE
jgi:tripartite-type tricarboxylate transporter receptor subunit TctC